MIASGESDCPGDDTQTLMYLADDYANALMRFLDDIEAKYTLTKKQIKAAG